MELSNEVELEGLEVHGADGVDETRPTVREYGSGEKTVGFVTGSHGDEKGPQELVNEVMDSIDADVRVSVINPANPSAAEDFSRRTSPRVQQNRADEADLNRSWMTAKKFLDGELEKQDINTTALIASRYLDYLRENVDIVVDLHTGTYPTRKAPQFRYIQGDEVMTEAATKAGVEAVLETKHDPGKGTLRSTLFDDNKPAGTVEVGGAARPGDRSGFSEEEEEKYSSIIENLVRHFSGEEMEEVETEKYTDIEKVHAPSAGIVRYRQDLGSEVEPGDTVAVIEDYDGEVREEVNAGYEGMLETVNTGSGRNVNEGNRIFNIARREKE
ncbi:MAG: succinylglutamate desuccinylase/aspartoacylase family protein [Candidatus Nanohaloarchaea archaeon]